jgi:hypothetical protein
MSGSKISLPDSELADRAFQGPRDKLNPETYLVRNKRLKR